MNTPPPRVVIVGCGNPNRSDDGAGQRVIQHLRARGVGAPESDVRVLDAGTDGMAVMFAARGCTTLMIVDACRSGAAPGAVFEAPGSELALDHTPTLNLHDFRWDHALAAGRRIFGAGFPSDVTVFLIEARSVELGLELCSDVETAALAVTARIEALLRERRRAF